MDHFKLSLKLDKLLPFHRSIFRDHFDTLDPVQEVHVLSDEKRDEMLNEESDRRKSPPAKKKVRMRIPSPEPATQIEDFGAFGGFIEVVKFLSTCHLRVIMSSLCHH